MQKHHWYWLIFATVIVIAATGILYEIYESPQPASVITPHQVASKQSTTSSLLSAFSSAQSNSIINTWKTYTNVQYGFKLQYPQNWQDTENAIDSNGEILDIAYNVQSVKHYEGMGFVYPGEIFVRGVTKKSILVPYGSTPQSNFLKFAQQYIGGGLDNEAIVSTSTEIDGHEAVEIDRVPGLTGPDTALVPNVTVLVNYSTDSVIWIEANYLPENETYVIQTLQQVLSTFQFFNSQS